MGTATGTRLGSTSWACLGRPIRAARSDRSSRHRPPKPTCTDAQALSWISAYGAVSLQVASNIGTSEADILGLSSYESNWGQGPFVKAGLTVTLPSGKKYKTLGGDDFFSLHEKKGTLLPDSVGWHPIPGEGNNGMAVYNSYLASAQSFAALYKGAVGGVTNPGTFAQDLKDAKFGAGNANFVSDLTSRINRIADCLSKM